MMIKQGIKEDVQHQITSTCQQIMDQATQEVHQASENFQEKLMVVRKQQLTILSDMELKYESVR